MTWLWYEYVGPEPVPFSLLRPERGNVIFLFCSSLVDLIRVVSPFLFLFLLFPSANIPSHHRRAFSWFPSVAATLPRCLIEPGLDVFISLSSHKHLHHDSSIRMWDRISGVWIWIWEVYVHYVCPHRWHSGCFYSACVPKRKSANQLGIGVCMVFQLISPRSMWLLCWWSALNGYWDHTWIDLLNVHRNQPFSPETGTSVPWVIVYLKQLSTVQLISDDECVYIRIFEGVGSIFVWGDLATPDWRPGASRPLLQCLE